MSSLQHEVCLVDSHILDVLLKLKERNIPKGEVLRAFLEYARISPEKVIFVDDREENVKSLEEVCQERGIEFLGFHYTEVENRFFASFDGKRIRYQFDVLEKSGRWLSDQEAASRRALLFEKES